MVPYWRLSKRQSFLNLVAPYSRYLFLMAVVLVHYRVALCSPGHLHFLVVSCCFLVVRDFQEEEEVVFPVWEVSPGREVFLVREVSPVWEVLSPVFLLLPRFRILVDSRVVLFPLLVLIQWVEELLVGVLAFLPHPGAL